MIDELQLYPPPMRVERISGATIVPDVITISGSAEESIAALFADKAVVSAPADAWIECNILNNSSHCSEYYKMSISESGIQVEAVGSKGIVHSLRTLKQLIRKFKTHIPCMIIEDEPLFPVRGIMLDISRDRVPTMKTLKELIDKLAEFKINHFQLYMEHTFAYAGHQTVWQNASPLTSDEMLELDLYCRVRDIELCANQNTLGHMERWLKHPEYAQLGEMDRPHIKDDGWFLEPNTLDPTNPVAKEFVKGLLHQLIPTCSGSFVNIGCDEPVDLGLGRSKNECDKNGTFRVYCNYVADIARYVIDAGKTPQFWVDPGFAEKLSDIGKMPKELVGMVYGYGYGKHNIFEKRIKNMIAAGHSVWTCPGTSEWRTFTGSTRTRRKNLSLAVATRSFGSSGFLLTSWGDSGHRQQWPITLLGIAEGAYAAWSGNAPNSADSAGLHLFDNPELGVWLEKLGLIEENLTSTLDKNSCFTDLTRSFFDPEGPDLEYWQSKKKKLEELRSTIPAGDSLPARECRHSFDMMEWALNRAILRRSQPEHKDRIELTRELIDLIETYKELWLCRSQRGGLADSVEKCKYSAHYF